MDTPLRLTGLTTRLSPSRLKQNSRASGAMPFLLQRGDVSNSADVDALIRSTVTRFGTIDVLVNNAAMQREAAAIDLSEEEFDRTLAVNLKGPFLCAQRACAGDDSARPGTDHQYQFHSPVCPQAIIPALRTLQSCLGNAYQKPCAGIWSAGCRGGGNCARRRAIHDGLTVAPDVLINSTPIFCAIARPEDVAVAVLYCSDSARFANGSTLVLDGGLMLGPYTRSDF